MLYCVHNLVSGGIRTPIPHHRYAVLHCCGLYALSTYIGMYTKRNSNLTAIILEFVCSINSVKLM